MTDETDRGAADYDGKMTESTWENLAMDELAELAWEPRPKEIAPGSVPATVPRTRGTT